MSESEEVRTLITKSHLQMKVDLKVAAGMKWRSLASSSLTPKKDDEADEDGLTPATLRTRFKSQVAVNDWLVIYSFIF